MKNLSYILKTALPLLLICAICAALLAAANYLTAPVIEKNAEMQKEEAIKNLLPDTDSYKEVDCNKDSVNALFEVKLSDGSVFYCVDVTAKSKYGGDVNMMVSVSREGDVADVQLINHSETFIDRYLDEDNKFTKIDCQSGATYSFNAIKDGMKIAQDAVKALLGL